MASHKKNQRLATISRLLGEGRTDASIIDEIIKVFRVSEATARNELKAVYTRWAAIDQDNAKLHKAKFLELGFNMLNEMRATMAMGPAAQQFKTLAQISGVFSDKVIVSDSPSSQNAAPPVNTVRSRIAELAKNPEIRKRAMQLGLDLAQIAVVESDNEE